MLVTYAKILVGVNKPIADPRSHWTMRKLMRAVEAGVPVECVPAASGRGWRVAMEPGSAATLDPNWRAHVTREKSARAWQQQHLEVVTVPGGGAILDAA